MRFPKEQQKNEIWFLLLQEVLTAEKCAQHIVVRGLVRVRCVQELDRVLHFMTRKGLINTGVLAAKQPLLPERFCSVRTLICLLFYYALWHILIHFIISCRKMSSLSVPGLQDWQLRASCKTLALR